MKRKRITNAFVVVLVIIEIISIFLVYKSGSNRETILDNVKLNEIDKYNNFALMIEQDGEYIESKTFPTSGYVLNEILSGCVDNNGNTLENALTYKNGIINLRTRTNAMCYLYFDEEEIYAAQYLIENVDSSILWDSTLEDDGYRFVGENPDNYICFGTTDKDTCTGNTDLYMYRIIGIFEGTDGKQHLKLIKKEALNETYMWEDDYESDINWEESDLYKGLNGISGGYYSNLFVGSSNYSYMSTSSSWYNKIETWTWTATNTQTYYKYDTASSSSIDNVGADYYYSWPIGIYNSEHKINTTTGCYQTSSGSAINCTTTAAYTYPEAKISLMYASDYALSLGATASTMTGSTYTNRTTLKTGWMHISNNDSGAPSQYEWTSSRYGVSGGCYDAWLVYSDGSVGSNFVDGAHSVRPVFYLIEDIQIENGTGSSSDPYIIN